MNIVRGAARVVTRTADATTAAAGAVGGAAITGVIGGVEGLEERKWPGKRIQIGEVLIEAAQLRQRCAVARG